MKKADKLAREAIKQSYQKINISVHIVWRKTNQWTEYCDKTTKARHLQCNCRTARCSDASGPAGGAAAPEDEQRPTRERGACC